jgi:hypothetical protein
MSPGPGRKLVASFLAPSKLGVGLAAIYLVLASYFVWVVLFGRNDGGIWLFMYFSYWPASILDLLLRETLKDFLPMNGSLLGVFDMSMCVVLGTFWYYCVGNLITSVFVRVFPRSVHKPW